MADIIVHLWSGDFRKQSRNAVRSTSALYLRGMPKGRCHKVTYRNNMK